ncbi:MAG: dTMP kinase [Polyangiaceae bacterium]|nr:dTMP kinase [Polyangiaceae bacterium]
MTAARGSFIVLEGIDGAGTSTQLELVARALEARGLAVHRTAEPSTGPVGNLIRQYLRKELPVPAAWDTMALLFAADRLDHVAREIEPLLARGSWVISDRYDLSSLAYQSATAPNARVVSWIRELNSRALRPDLTVIVDVPADAAAARRGARGGREELYERDELQARLAEIYAQGEALVPGDSVRHVSGLGAPAEVTARVLAVVDAALRTPSPP